MEETLNRLRLALPSEQFAAVNLWLETFYPFQRRWLLDRRQYAALNKCRQIGGSFAFSGWAALPGIWGESCVLVSRAETEAVDLLSKAALHCRALSELGASWARIVESSQLQIRLTSGAIIRATTSKAAGRGFSGNVVLDEFAYHERQQDVWDAALAATTHGYSCRILSTPNGVGDLWHQLCTEIGHRDPDRRDGWLVYSTTIDDAIKDGMRLDMEKAWTMARGDARVFDQLFRGVFIDSDAQYLPAELIARRTIEEGPDPFARSHVAGLDIGEKRDRTCLVVLSGGKQGWRPKHIETHARTDDLLLARLIDEAFNVHGVTRLCLDATGMGTFPAQAARRKHGPKIEPVTFTSSVKEAMASALYQAMSEGKLELPRHGPESQELRDDLASIRRIVTTAGNVRFDAPRTDKGHADRAWALMLALQATEHAESRNAFSELQALRANTGKQ